MTQTHRVLLTGCSGFLGPFVIDELVAAGHEVVGFDLLTPANKTDPFIRGDFTSKRDLVRALTGITAVCHLGGVGDVYLAERRGAAALRTNAYGTKIVCDACMDSGVETLVYASTWEVYGKPHANPVSETHPCNPESLYSISKLAGELFVRRAGAINGMTTSLFMVMDLSFASSPTYRISGERSQLRPRPRARTQVARITSSRTSPLRSLTLPLVSEGETVLESSSFHQECPNPHRPTSQRRRRSANSGGGAKSPSRTGSRS